MKHLYWIICGVIVIALIATWVLVVPSDEAAKSKSNLDGQTKALTDLEKRANAGDPIKVFDPENPADTEELANQYLITPRWSNVLQPLIEKYQRQLDGIKAQLEARDAWLRRPVAMTSNLNEWYNAYVKASEDLITRLKTANCVRVPPEQPGAIVVAAGGGESPRALRDAVGLFTKSNDYPDPSKHPLLTTRLRVLEELAGRLIDSRIAVAASPLYGPTGHGEDSSAATPMITSIIWHGGPDQTEQTVHTAISDRLPVKTLGFALTLEGPASALISSVSLLERNTEADRPMIVVNAATLQRRPYILAERYDIAAEPATLVLDVSIITFGDQVVAAAGVAGGQPGTQPTAPGTHP